MVSSSTMTATKDKYKHKNTAFGFCGTKNEFRVKRTTEKTLATLPTKCDKHHSRQQHEHMKHQEKQGLQQVICDMCF